MEERKKKSKGSYQVRRYGTNLHIHVLLISFILTLTDRFRPTSQQQQMYAAGAENIVAVNKACTHDMVEAKEEYCQEILVYEIIKMRQAEAQLYDLAVRIEDAIAAQTNDFVTQRQ